MYERILAVMAAPQTWRTVLSQVERLANGHHVEVTLLALAETPAGAAERWRENLEKQLDRQARTLRHKGLTVHTAVRVGSPAREIITYSLAHPADIIVMATPPRAA